MSVLPYNDADPYSIEAYAQRLLNKNLRNLVADPEELLKVIKGKGSLGQAIEQYYFLYPPNPISGPDFPNAGLELKTTPILADKKRKYRAKERLVLNVINYKKDHDKEFINSSFWQKNSLLLLMFYLHEKEHLDIDLIFKIVRLFRFSAVDLKIIKDDWETIQTKIRNGLAHELSEGDTFYLGACTKGAKGIPTKVQPFSTELAKPRAYSLKAKYVNTIIQKTLSGDFELTDQTEGYRKVLNDSYITDPLSRHSTVKSDGTFSPIIKSVDEFKPGETVEQLITRRFEPYYGYLESQLFEELGLKKSSSKSKAYNLSRAILNVKGKIIEEFEKADLELKTVTLEKSGSLKESMSFPYIRYDEIIEEEWESSTLLELLTRRFLFVVFKKNEKGEPYLLKLKFWNMPNKDLELMKEIWTDAKSKILKKDYNNFIKISDGKIGHVRPHDVKGPNKCFWLNSSYIKSIIS
jgi:DNA mismatch repair protein MutH